MCNGAEEESSVRNYTFSVVALRGGKNLSLTQCLMLSEVKTRGEQFQARVDCVNLARILVKFRNLL